MNKPSLLSNTTPLIKYDYRKVDACNMCGQKVFNKIGKRLNRSQGFNPKKLNGILTSVMSCDSCQLIFSNPMPIPEKITDHYNTPPDTYWTKEFLTYNPEYFSRQIKNFFKLYQCENGNGLKALDVGAGIGKAMISLEKAGFSVQGMEPSKSFYDKAIQDMGVNESNLHLESIESVELEDEVFDFITFGNVLEHFYDPSYSLGKAMNWLKPGGIMHVEIPNSSYLSNKIINFIYRLRGMDYCANLSPMHSPFHLYEFNIKSFEENGKINNYKILEKYYWECMTYLPKVLDPILLPIMRKTNTGLQLEVWLQRLK